MKRAGWFVAGTAAMAYGGYGLVTSTSSTALRNAARGLAAALLAHDAVIAPLVAAVAVLTARLVPVVARTAVRAGLALSGLLVLLALPILTSPNRLRNPSVLPLPYERNLGLLLGCVGVGTIAAIVVSVRSARRAHATEPSRTPPLPPPD